jgi:hypothetical protein
VVARAPFVSLTRLFSNVQWLGPGSDLLLYNDRGCQHQQQQGGGSLAAKDALCAVIFSIEQRRRVRVLPRAIYAASPDGSQGLSGDWN